MISGKKNVETWFSLQGKPYFTIYQKGKSESGNYVFTNKEKENVDMLSAVPFLSQCLALISAGEFQIICNEDQKISSKGRSETLFSVSVNEAAATTAPAPQVSGVVGYTHEQMIAEAGKIAKEQFEQLMDKRELADTKKQVAELQKENKELVRKVDAPMSKFMDSLGPHMPAIISGFFPNQGAPAGIGNIPKADPTIVDNNDNTPVDLSEADQQQMSETVQTFCEALATRYPVNADAPAGYQNWLQILQKLTHTLQTNPKTIDAALNFL